MTDSGLCSDLMELILKRGSCTICHSQMFILLCLTTNSAIKSSAEVVVTLSNHRWIKSLVSRASSFVSFPNVLWDLIKKGMFFNSYHGYNEQLEKYICYWKYIIKKK